MPKAKEELVRIRLPRPIKDEENFVIVSERQVMEDKERRMG